MKQRSIYLDYAATTPVDQRVVQAMQPYFSEEFGNPGSLHQFGQRASAAVFQARQTVAQVVGAHYSEIVFTGSATEANNLVLGGVMRRYVREQLKMKAKHPMPRIIISAIEHESVLKTAQDLARDGADVVIIPVSKEGVVDVKKLKAALNEQTALVSVMLANNETGVIQPIATIAKIVREFRGEGRWPLVHTDAVQAFQYVDCNVSVLGVDMLTLSAHKIYGPKGVGALYIKNAQLSSKRPLKDVDTYPIDPLIVGGGQEMGLRSGTENVAYIVGFAKAVALAVLAREKEAKRIAELRNALLAGLRTFYPKLQVNGSMKERLPNNINIYMPGVSAEEFLVRLDLAGVALSSGSACAARSLEASHVLLAMGYTAERAKNSLRFTLGRQTTRQEIASVLKLIASFGR
jgi:cysteine desulfurase